jgi:hypothetical protein
MRRQFMEAKMRRFVLLAVLLVTLLPIGRHAGALPAFGHFTTFYANACNPVFLVSAGSPGDYLGEDIRDCSNHYQDGVLEQDLVGYKNWKEEEVFDCQNGETISYKWYVGGYGHWTEATPTQCWYEG